MIISNCVINLSGDKPAVFREAARVLSPGGRFAVSDVVADAGMDEATRRDMEQWTGCIAGALTAGEFQRELRAPGSARSRLPRDPPRPRPGLLGDHSGHEPPRPMHPGGDDLKDPQQLYLDWERAHWAAQDIDLGR